MKLTLAKALSSFLGSLPLHVSSLDKKIIRLGFIFLTCLQRKMEKYLTLGKCDSNVKIATLIFRNRIHEEFNDGDECIVLLKNRAVTQDEDMKIWYERAFGSQRNLMSLSFKYLPPALPKHVTPRVFVELQYNMFPEMMEEFNASDYKNKELLEL